MIINIPINIDEHIFEEKVQKDYEKILTNELVKMVDKYLISEDHNYYRTSDPAQGIKYLVNQTIDRCVQEWKDEIVDKAADILAKRVQRTKKAKEELINGAEDNT